MGGQLDLRRESATGSLVTHCVERSRHRLGDAPLGDAEMKGNYAGAGK